MKQSDLRDEDRGAVMIRCLFRCASEGGNASDQIIARAAYELIEFNSNLFFSGLKHRDRPA